jgi:hypothetical protein
VQQVPGTEFKATKIKKNKKEKMVMCIFPQFQKMEQNKKRVLVNFKPPWQLKYIGFESVVSGLGAQLSGRAFAQPV